jgi:hypothetical protein
MSETVADKAPGRRGFRGFEKVFIAQVLWLDGGLVAGQHPDALHFVL